MASPRSPLAALLLLGLLSSSVSAQVEQVWLTRRSSDPSKVVVNWTTKQPGRSIVRWGKTTQYEHEVEVALPGRLLREPSA